MKSLLLFERGGGLRLHHILDNLLWIVMSILLLYSGYLHGLITSGDALSFPAAHQAACHHHIACHHHTKRLNDAESLVFSRKKHHAAAAATAPYASYAAATPQGLHAPSAPKALHSISPAEQHCQRKDICDHSGAETVGHGGQIVNLLHSRCSSSEVSAASCCTDDSNGSGAAHNNTTTVCCTTCPTSTSLGAFHVEYTLPCSANGGGGGEQHCWSGTSLAAAVDDQMLQQRLRVAARIYADPTLSEALRLHNKRQQASLLTAKQQRGHQKDDAQQLLQEGRHHRQLQESSRQQQQQSVQRSHPVVEQQPRRRMRSGEQQTAGQDGWQHQLVQHHQQNPLYELAVQLIRQRKQRPQQRINGAHRVRQPGGGDGVGATVVALENEEQQQQQQKGASRHTLSPLQADLSQDDSRDTAAAAARSDLNMIADNPQRGEAATTTTDLEVSGWKKSSGYARECRKQTSSESLPRESGSTLNPKDSKSCAPAQTKSSPRAGGRVKEEVEGGRRVLPLARPIGSLLRQLQQHSCHRFSTLMQLKDCLFGSGTSGERETTCADSSSSSTSTTNDRRSTGSRCSAGSTQISETADAQIRSTNIRQSTKAVSADVQRLLDASLIVARVVRCSKCSAGSRASGRYEIKPSDLQEGPQSKHDSRRTAGVWHVLPASGFFVHSSGVLVTSFHVIAPSAKQEQQPYRQQDVAIHEVLQENRQNQMQLQAAFHSPQDKQTQSESEQQQQLRREHHHHYRLHIPANRKEIEEGNAAASFTSSPSGGIRHQADDQREDMQQEVLVVMDRTSRCWPVKSVLAASPHHDLAVLQIDWEGVTQPDELYRVAPSSTPAAASPLATTQATPLATVPQEAMREERGFKSTSQCRQMTTLRPPQQQQQEDEQQVEPDGEQQEKKQQHREGQQQNDGETQKEQQERDTQRLVLVDPEDSKREGSYAVGEIAGTWREGCQQGESGERSVPWLPLQKRGVQPDVGSPILVCSNPSGLAVTADFAQGSSGGAAVDAVTGRVIGVAQSTSSLYGNASAWMKATAPVFQPYPLHPPLQMVVKTCIPVGYLGLVIDEALAQQQALSLPCGTTTCSSSEPAATAAVAA